MLIISSFLSERNSLVITFGNNLQLVCSQGWKRRERKTESLQAPSYAACGPWVKSCWDWSRVG